MSKGSSSNTKVILGVLGGVALGGAVFLAATKCMKRSDDDDENLTIRPGGASSKKSSPLQPTEHRAAAAERPASTVSTSGQMKPAASTEDTLMTNQSTVMMNDFSFEAGGGAEGGEGGAGIPSMAQPDENGVVHFPMLGVDWQLAPGWLANEDAAPMPNVAMVQLLKPEFLEQMEAGPGGMAPVVLFGVEDVSAEALSVHDYRDKTKELTMQQLTMMTGGQFQPIVVFDGPMSIGPFTHVIEFALATPFAKLQVLNIIAMAAGVAYCVRVMATSTEFAKIRGEVMTMVRGSTITPKLLPVPFTQWSYIEASSTKATCKVPTSWVVNTAVPATGNVLFAFMTMSTFRMEEITIYEAESAQGVADTASWRETSAVDTPAGRLVTYKSGTSGDRRVLSTGTFVLVVVSANGTTMEDSTLVTVAQSLKTQSNSTQSLRFHSERLGCAFEVDVIGRLFESRIAERTATYHPTGAGDPERAAEGPLLTIRVGDPSNDTDCQSSLAEWKSRIESEQAKSDGAIRDLKSETIQGRECISFVNKDMIESGPGQREERLAKVIIFLVGIKTVMLRWEASTGAYRRSERKLQAFLSSFQIL